MTKTKSEHWLAPRNGAADCLGGVTPLVKPLFWVGVICGWLVNLSSTIPFTGFIAWLIGLAALEILWSVSVERSWWQTLSMGVRFQCATQVIKVIQIFTVLDFLVKLRPRFYRAEKAAFSKPLVCRPAVQAAAPNQYVRTKSGDCLTKTSNEISKPGDEL